MPLPHSGMCALYKDKSHTGNMLIHTSLNSFNFCAHIEGKWRRKDSAEATRFYVMRLWVFNKMFGIINHMQ